MACRIPTTPTSFVAHASVFSITQAPSYKVSCVGNGEGAGGSAYIPPPPSGGQGPGAGAPRGPHDPSDGGAPIDRQIYDRLISLIQLSPTITPLTRLTPNSIAFRGWLEGKEISLKNGRAFTITYVDRYLHSIAVFTAALHIAADIEKKSACAEELLQKGNEARSLVQGYNASNTAICLMRGVAEHLGMASEFARFTANYRRIDDRVIASSLAFDRAIAGVAALVAFHQPTFAKASRTQRALTAAVRNEPAFLALQPLCEGIAQKWARIEQSGTLPR